MRHKIVLFLFLSAVMTGVCLQDNPSYAGQEQMLSTPDDKIQYAIGVEIARNFKSQGMELDLDLVMKGMHDALSGGGLLVSEKELRGILISIQSEIRRKRAISKKLPDAGNKSNQESGR